MSGPALQRILGLYQSGQAEQALREADLALSQAPTNADILHIRALALRKLGRLEEALTAMQAAVDANSENPELRNTFGNMLKAAGDLREAESSYRAAIHLRNDYAPAHRNLANLLIDQHFLPAALKAAEAYVSTSHERDPDAFEVLGRARKTAKAWRNAILAFEKAIALAPSHVAARYGLASCLIETGAAGKCETLCDALIREGQTAPQILRLLARARLEQSRFQEAEPPLHQAIAAGSPDALKDYANVLWMTGRSEEADHLLASAVQAAGQRPDQSIAAFDEFLDMERPARVQSLHSGLARVLQDDPNFMIRLSMAKSDLGQTEEAFGLAETAHKAMPDHRNIAYQYIVSALMSGRYDAALRVVETWRARESEDQNWVALQGDAWRMLGRLEDYQRLNDFDRFVKPAQLPVPVGYASLEEFHADFIEQVHGSTPYKTHPLGQSARQGIQSPMNLLFDDRPVVQNYIKALHEPVQAYVDQLGRDPANPMTSRNVGEFYIGGVWSIFLLAGGRHVSHTHPKGWVSSAYYMAVPPEADDEEARPGWIKFGEPPYKLPDPAPAGHWVKPTPGTLVLFPAYMWHGTVPISGRAPRVAAPLDILPGAAL